MTEKKEKEQKKKITPGMAATANRLETSHAVLSALKEVGSISGGQAASLASAAQAALALLKVVQVRVLSWVLQGRFRSQLPEIL